MAAKTHYQVLGITRSATLDEIRRAFRALAKTHHPDASGTTGSDRVFAEIAVAYEVLAEPEKRRDYDRRLSGLGSVKDEPRTSGPAHYTWTNVAAEETSPRSGATRPRVTQTEFDEIYKTFFGSSGTGVGN